MSAITSLSSATSAATSSATAAATSGTDAADRFLTLLVTQLKNQDPLNPLDNAQLTSQLAQINTVSGINKLNDTVASLAASISAGQSLQAVGLVGHTVVVPGNQMTQSGGKGASGAFSLPSAADSVTIAIKDAGGAVVRTMTLSTQAAGLGQFAWDGKNDAGAVAKDGAYTYDVTATAAGTAVTATALMSGTVIGLAAGTNGMQLDLGKLGKFDLAQVVELN